MAVNGFNDVEQFVQANHVRSVAEFRCGDATPFARLAVAHTRYDLYPKLVAHLRASFNPTPLDVDYSEVRAADLCLVSSALLHWPPETARRFLDAVAGTHLFKHVLVCDDA